MSRIRFAMAALLPLGLIIAPDAAAQYPTTPPSAAPLRPVRFPPFVNATLANGARLLVVENHRQPVVTISLTMRAGAYFEPADRAGLSSIVADLLTKGTARRTAEQLSAEIEGAGGSIGAGAGDDHLTITLSVLSASLPQALDLLADVVANSTFPESEVDLSRTRELSNLQASLAQPEVLAGRAFSRAIYGDHPYGRAETPATLRAITREDVVRFHAERIRPAGALLVIAGDVNPAQVRTLADRALASWRGAPAAAPVAPAIPAAQPTSITLVHKPGAVQSNIVAGFPFIVPSDPDVYPLTLLNRVLGGGADSRLFMILREEKGWTYGAYSGFSRRRETGAFQATAEVRTEVTDSALGELIRQVERIRNEVPSDSEITAARNFIVGSFPLTIETPEQIAGAVANARLLGLPDDYVVRYRERLSAVTRAQLAAAARRRLTTDRMSVIVVGDAPRILAGLRAIAPVRIVDTDGRPLTEEDLSPRSSAFALNGAAVTAGTWRYRILVQGNPFGEETRTIARAQQGGRDTWRMITTTRLGPIISQDDTVVVETGSLSPVGVRQGGTIQGQPVHVRLDYAGGRVRGSSRAPQANGQFQDRTIDTTVAAGTFDDNQLPLVLMAFPLTAGGRWNLPVFSGGDGIAKIYTVAVDGEDSVTVPAGTIPVWRLTVTGGQTPVTMYVSKATPHVVVKLELVGAPVAFELTQGP